ncbi:glycosyltransferase family 2 protein [Bizionia psychrotolerans]|uniref:glycosyltransferase family 2 protein n=1 Tax=Bizionia psychrotolerans TaxID=1492901 RepID=UPI00069D2AAA|nr:glycosyltransferase family 2 protein [Bizionia psychrotolerans]
MLISIITINYNDVVGLKKTMISVLEQTYADIEYIVIDGGSTDGSLDLIKAHKEKLAYWVSEPDKGIYHAMNKGIDQATGAYLLFLNGGDWLVDSSIIEKFVAFKPVEDLVYGDVFVRKGHAWRRKFMPKEMSFGMALSNTLAHQAEFYKRGLFDDDFRYDTSYQVVSDWILTNHAIVFKQATSRYIDLVVCYFEDPGISSDFNLRHTERKRYLKANFDPLFLNLLKDYQRLHGQNQTLKGRFLVQVAVWIQDKRNRLFKTTK